MRHSILWRILVPYLLLLLAVLAVLSIFLSGFLRSTYLERTEVGLFSDARLVRSEIESLLLADPANPQISDIVLRDAALLGVRVTVIMADGRVVGESEKPVGQMENHFNRPEVQQALLNKEDSKIRYSDTLKTDLLYVAVPLTQAGKVVAVVRLAEPLHSIQTSLNQLYLTVGIAARVSALLTALLAVAVTRSTLRPLGSLSQALAQMRAGTLPDMEVPKSKDELSVLQLSFRGMSEELHRQITELRAERGKLEAVLANMTDGIIIADAQGTILRVNPAAARMFNTAANQALGKSLIEVVRQHQFVELWRKCQQTGEQQSLSLEVATERLFVQAIASPLGKDMEGAVLLVFQDLTRIRKLETVRRDFVSNVSHELRTPLASVKALAETLHEGALEDPPAARRFLQQMESEIDNITQLVHELLELSRIESGRVPLERRSINPCEFLKRGIERMQMQAERAGLSLRLECTEQLPEVNADPERIQQVLVNLIHNAVKFTRPGGEIVVTATPRDHDVIVAVRDTGVGIAPEELTRIFERFYKADRSRSGGGTGLGLSIARHLVEAHGGRIWAESELDKGSVFYFTLPAA
jgi:two-component system phosphate regulon sensor histidine kinase PhoR